MGYLFCALTVAAPLKVKVQELAAVPPLLQAPDQTAPCPSEVFRVIEVPMSNTPDPVFPEEALMPAEGVVVISPPPPDTVTVSTAVLALPPQTFGVPPPPHAVPPVQVPQLRVPPHPLGTLPQVLPNCAQV